MADVIPWGELGGLALGTGTSLFQAEPLIGWMDSVNWHPTASDWDYLVRRKFNWQTAEYPDMKVDEPMPRFIRNAAAYINRSRELGCKMFRLSFEWPRLCPHHRVFNDELMARYVGVLARISACGQEPFVTMHHYTLPFRLTEIDVDGRIIKGGWEHPHALREFMFYIRSVAAFLNDDDKMRRAIDAAGIEATTRDKMLAEGFVRYFMSINEPAAILSHGYITGIFHPHKRWSLVTAQRILQRLVAAHDMVRSELDIALSDKGGALVGVGYNWQLWEGVIAPFQRWLDEWVTDAFERDSVQSDFIGLQYYFRMRSPISKRERARRDWSDHPGFGDVYPAGIRAILERMHTKYKGKPIFVTEFGFADKADLERPFWILETVRHILEARKSGVPMQGILYWSLVDNFEWDRGMAEKFGLFAESKLNVPLSPVNTHLRSWEVWRALCNAATQSTPENSAALQEFYKQAHAQYRSVGGVY